MQFKSSSESYSSSIKNAPSIWGNESHADYGHKTTSSYKYARSSNNINETRNSSNIDQLDVLLEDLKNERRISKEKDYGLPVEITNKTQEPENINTTIPLLSQTFKTSNPIEATLMSREDKTLGANYSTHKYYEYQHKSRSEELPVILKSTSSHKTNLNGQIEDIALPTNLLPPPGTKVTTTVRTYTYEIPGDEALITTKNNNSTEYNSQSSYNVQLTDEAGDISSYEQCARNKIPSIESSYHTQSSLSQNKDEKHAGSSNQVYEMREMCEISSTAPPQPINQTLNSVVYNVTSTKQTSFKPQISSGLAPHLPVEHVGTAPNNHTITTIVDKRYTKHGDKLEPSHKYNYEKSTSNAVSNQLTMDYTVTLSKPAPFPVEPVDFKSPAEITPKQVDELMQSFDNTDLNSSDLRSTLRKREVDTAVASPNKQHVPTINRAGKEVFYPPGHEMSFSKRQEMSAAQAGGRWAKGSGMYEYEAGAKSSSKSKSGGTMVPVCLPLCCAMPCSIM